MKFLDQGFQKLKHKQETETDRRDCMHYQPHSQVVTIKCNFFKLRTHPRSCAVVFYKMQSS